MATKTKKTQLGNYITKVNNYDIRMKASYKKNDKGKMVMSSHEYVVCRGRKVVKTGLKTKDEAVNFANAN